MTLILTVNHPQAIIMSADSRRTEEGTTYIGGNPIGQPYRNFSFIQKLYPMGGAGCFSYWGDDITELEVELPKHLKKMREKPIKCIHDLKDWVFEFLHDILKPHENNRFPVGFHVGGFDSEENPQIFHIFYGWQADVTDIDATAPDYHVNDHSKWFAVYNGVPSHAHAIFQFLADLKYQVGMKTWIGEYGAVLAARLNDYTIRYTSQIADTVGDAVFNNIILPNNKQLVVINTTPYPMELATLSFRLQQLKEGKALVDVRQFSRVMLKDPLIDNQDDILPVAVES